VSAPTLRVMPDSSPLVEIRRSARRRRTVSAYRDGEKIVILLPARMSRSEEQRLVTEMIERVTSREARLASRGPRAGDGELSRRATELSRRYLVGHAQPAIVRWVTNMHHRWGSCTPAEGSIRLSHRLQAMPSWVIDYVLLHELAHLLEPGHGPEFWSWVERYPRTERARGFLDGVAFAAQVPGLSPSGGGPSTAGPPASSPGGCESDGCGPDGCESDGCGPDDCASGALF